MKGRDGAKAQPPTASQHACKQERSTGGQQGWVVEENIHNNKHNTTIWQPCRHGMHKTSTQCTMPNQRQNNQADTTEKHNCTHAVKGQQSTMHASQRQSHTDTEVYGQKHELKTCRSTSKGRQANRRCVCVCVPVCMCVCVFVF